MLCQKAGKCSIKGKWGCIKDTGANMKGLLLANDGTVLASKKAGYWNLPDIIFLKNLRVYNNAQKEKKKMPIGGNQDTGFLLWKWAIKEK